MATSATKLNADNLKAFTEWLLKNGWKQQDPREDNEVLRMTRRGKYGLKVLLVIDDNGTLVSMGISRQLLDRWREVR